jgi:subtilase family serine protease
MSVADRKNQSLIAAIESLELRTLFAATVDGFTPEQVRKAYGFDQIDFGTIAANGAGQTIAIVNAFSHPNIAADLQVFSDQFDLPDANLTIVNQRGGSTLPATNDGWASEIALDVEWVHAIAPAAKILLVEADSDTTDDLMIAVDYARKVPGVSVVSMSWGGDESFGFNGGEAASQLEDDAIFTTPAGHQGVTFVAASGDSGARSVLWPASSPNVLSVGGTRLVTDDSGAYGSETGWSSTSRGYSKIEAEPSYQQAVQNTGRRSTSDVSYNADPSTGFAVYDSFPDGDIGWDVIGGTSAGAPQWAAMVAIIDQGLASLGKGSLDGATQTIPQLYALYSAKDSAGNSLYSTYFHDVASGGASGGFGAAAAGASAGYDLVTGLGTPKAAAIVAKLSGKSTSSGSSTGGGTTTGGTTTGGTTTGGDPIPDTDGTPDTTSGGGTTSGGSLFSGVFSQTPIASVVAGNPGKQKLTITNTSGVRIAAPVTITVSLSSDAAASGDDTTLLTLPIPELKLEAGRSKTIKLKFNYGADTLAAGTYYTIAVIAITGSVDAPSLAVTQTTTTIEKPIANLVETFGGATSIHLTPGKRGVVTITLKNEGNVAAEGTLDLNLYASADATQDPADPLLATLPTKNIHIKPGKTIRLRLKFVVPDLGGSQFLIAAANPILTRGAEDPTDDVVAIPLT